MKKQILVSMSLVALALVGCGDVKVESVSDLFPQTQSYPQTSKPAPQAPNESLVVGAEMSPKIQSMNPSTQSFYYSLEKVSGKKLSVAQSSEVSACSADPTYGFSLVTIEGDTETLIRNLAEDEAFEVSADTTTFLKFTVNGLSNCMGYGTSFTATTL